MVQPSTQPFIIIKQVAANFVYMSQSINRKLYFKEGKDKGQYICIAPYCRQPTSKVLGCQVISQFYLHTHAFIRGWNEPYLPVPSQPKLVLIYWPWRDGRLSWSGQPERWVNSRTAGQCLSQLLTGQSITSHCPELLPGVVEAGVEPRPFESQSDTLTTTSPRMQQVCNLVTAMASIPTVNMYRANQKKYPYVFCQFFRNNLEF